MLDTETQKRLLRKRVEALSFPDSLLVEAAEIIRNSGMKVADAVTNLRKEWLNDLVATTDSIEFKRAASNPSAHFLAFVAERSKKPYHVTYRAVEAVARRFGSDLASRYTHIVWPQEIAWAQRLRLDVNPNTATRAAMFLRETEGNPAKIFGKIADLYSDAIAKIGYTENPAHELSAVEIRFDEKVPEFNPLFLKYASRHYSEILQNMSRDKVEILAARAAKDERQDRSLIAARKVVETTRRFPMRRLPNVISLAKSIGLTSNELYRLEKAFLVKMEQGEIELEQGLNSPHIAFVTTMTDENICREMLSISQQLDIDEANTQWEVANISGRRWVKDLPVAFNKWTDIALDEVEKWQLAIVEERRPVPIDLVSDFGFWLMDVA